MCRKRLAISAFVLALLPTLFRAADRRELMGSWEGAGYHLQLPGSGGVAPYRWRVSDGQLPPGMKMDEATGVLSADSLEKRGTYDFSVALTDATAKTVSENLRVVVLAPVDTRVPLQIMTESLPTGIKEQSYNVVIATRGGVQPVYCSATAALPQGLSIDSKTCHLHGTPTKTGDAEFRLTAQDSNATPARVYKDYRFNVVSQPISWWWVFLGGIVATIALIVILGLLAARKAAQQSGAGPREKDQPVYCPQCNIQVATTGKDTEGFDVYYCPKHHGKFRVVGHAEPVE